MSFGCIVGTTMGLRQLRYEHIVERELFLTIQILTSIRINQYVDVIVDIAYLLLHKGIAAARRCHIVHIVGRIEVCLCDIAIWQAIASAAAYHRWARRHIHHHDTPALALVMFHIFQIIIYKYFGE